MEIPHNYLENLQARGANEKARSYRESLLNTALKEINKGRVGTDFKPMTFMGIKVKTQHLSDSDLSWLLAHCLKAKCGFSKAWFGSLKPNK
jgi:hypothetical protein